MVGLMTNLVSIIIPCLNEEKHIGYVIDAIANQTFPMQLMEVLIADGGSIDNTVKIIQSKQVEYPDLAIKIIDNPKKIIPAALNQAIRASLGEIIIRMDAHAIPDENYVKYCVENLSAMIAENVGGLWLIQPGDSGWMAKSISLAASHPFGVGDAKYRYSSKSAFVDTVPFGAFNRDLFNKIGLFDEKLLANEDYEFNMRIKKNGGKIYFDPRITTKYFARGTISALAKQYWRYGFWKFQMLKKFPKTIRFRQAIPPIFVLGLFLLLVMSLFISWMLTIFVGLLLLYLLILLLGIIPLYKKEKDLRLFIGVTVAIITMHFSWGSGFMASIFKKQRL